MQFGGTKIKSNTTSRERQMQNEKMEAALKYQQAGFSVIPVKKNKKPFIKWEKYQHQRASKNQIQQWWQRWPDANPAIVTGEISGVDVVDVDNEEGWKALNEFLGDSSITPISKTPAGGYHVYFKHRAGLSNGVRIIVGCDLRTNGGYVLAPPSDTEYQKNGKHIKGDYQWLTV
jgi:hypothetical protein